MDTSSLHVSGDIDSEESSFHIFSMSVCTPMDYPTCSYSALHVLFGANPMTTTRRGEACLKLRNRRIRARAWGPVRVGDAKIHSSMTVLLEFAPGHHTKSCEENQLNTPVPGHTSSTVSCSDPSPLKMGLEITNGQAMDRPRAGSFWQRQHGHRFKQGVVTL